MAQSARLFLHPRLVNSQVANGAFAAHLIEKGYDMVKGYRAVFRHKYFELCRVVSETPTSAVYAQLDGEEFMKGIVDPPTPLRAA